MHAGTPPPPASSRAAAVFQNHLTLVVRDLVGLAEAMPADKYEFKPSSGEFAGVRTFAEQVKHAATMIYMTAAIVLEEKSPHGPGSGDNGPEDVRAKADVIAYLEGAVAYARRAMGSLTEQNAFDPLKTYFGWQPRAEVAAGIVYHSYNHYGQLVIYARLNGIVPPASRHP